MSPSMPPSNALESALALSWCSTRIGRRGGVEGMDDTGVGSYIVLEWRQVKP